MSETKELVGAVNSLPKRQVQFKNNFALQEAIQHFNYPTSMPEWIGQLLYVVCLKKKEKKIHPLKKTYIKEVILSDLIWGERISLATKQGASPLQS